MLSPMNEIGPQKAVVTDARISVATSVNILVLFILIPRLIAYSSPNIHPLSGLIRNTANMSPISINDRKITMLSVPTPLKLPIPQIIREYAPSADV